jgi:hypothetical protein
MMPLSLPAGQTFSLERYFFRNAFAVALALASASASASAVASASAFVSDVSS